MEIQCKCGKSIPVPEKPESKTLTCTQCNAIHPIPGAKPLPKWVVIGSLAAVVAACGIWLFIKLSKKDETPPPPDPKAIYEAGMVEYKKANFLEAYRHFEIARHLDPTAYNAHYYCGACLRILGHYRDAIEPLSRAVEAQPHDLRFQTDYADALGDAGFRDQAIDLLEKIVASNKDALPPAFALAKAYRLSDSLEKAEPISRRIAEKTEYKASIFVEILYRVLVDKGNVAELRNLAAQAARALPGGAGHWLVTQIEAAVLREENKLSEAVQRIEQTLPSLSAGSTEWFHLMRSEAMLHLDRGDFDKVLPLTASMLAQPLSYANIFFRSDAALLRVEALLLLDKLEEAKKEAEKCLGGIDPDADATREILASLRLVTTGKREELLAVIPKLSIRAHNDYWMFLAAYYKANKDDAAFKEFIQKASESTIRKNFPYFLIERMKK